MSEASLGGAHASSVPSWRRRCRELVTCHLLHRLFPLHLLRLRLHRKPMTRQPRQPRVQPRLLRTAKENLQARLGRMRRRRTPRPTSSRSPTPTSSASLSFAPPSRNASSTGREFSKSQARVSLDPAPICHIPFSPTFHTFQFSPICHTSHFPPPCHIRFFFLICTCSHLY